MNNYEAILLIWNIVVMIFYGIDKMLSKTQKRRISERALLLYALFMGGGGALLGMVLFNHKTSKLKFRILVPLVMIIQVIVMHLKI